MIAFLTIELSLTGQLLHYSFIEICQLQNWKICDFSSGPDVIICIAFYSRVFVRIARQVSFRTLIMS